MEKANGQGPTTSALLKISVYGATPAPRRSRGVLRSFQLRFYNKFVEKGSAKFATSGGIGADVVPPMSRSKPADVADGCATRHRRR
jgi:hypothetical protein